MAESTIRRECGPCTACCEGWHTAIVNGHEMYPGRPCHFFLNGCTIYKDRPKDPCVNYSCDWLNDKNNTFPEWFRPDLSGVIITTRPWGNNKSYYEFREANKPMTAANLAWIYEFGARHNHCIRIEINGYWHAHGDHEFATSFPPQND